MSSDSQYVQHMSSLSTLLRTEAERIANAAARESQRHTELLQQPTLIAELTKQLPVVSFQQIGNVLSWTLDALYSEMDTGEETASRDDIFRELSGRYERWDQSFKSLMKKELTQYCNNALAVWQQQQKHSSLSSCQVLHAAVDSFNAIVENMIMQHLLAALELQNHEDALWQLVCSLLSFVHFKTCIVYHGKFESFLEQSLLLLLELIDTETVSMSFWRLCTSHVAKDTIKAVIYCELSINGFKKDRELSERYAQKGLECCSGFAELYNIMAHATSMKSGNTMDEERTICQQAMAYHRSSLQYAPNASVYHMNIAILCMGKLYRLMQRMVPAERDQVRELFDPMPYFAKSLELNPYNDTTLISRAREYKYRGLTHEAIEDYRRAIANLNPQKTYVCSYYMMELAEISTDDNEVVDLFTRALVYEDSKARPFIGRARAYTKLGNFTRAYADYRSVQHLPNNGVCTLPQQFRLLRALGMDIEAMYKLNWWVGSAIYWDEQPVKSVETPSTPGAPGDPEQRTQQQAQQSKFNAKFSERALVWEKFDESYLATRDHDLQARFDPDHLQHYSKLLVSTKLVVVSEDYDSILEMLD